MLSGSILNEPFSIPVEPCFRVDEAIFLRSCFRQPLHLESLWFSKDYDSNDICLSFLVSLRLSLLSILGKSIKLFPMFAIVRVDWRFQLLAVAQDINNLEIQLTTSYLLFQIFMKTMWNLCEARMLPVSLADNALKVFVSTYHQY